MLTSGVSGTVPSNKVEDNMDSAAFKVKEVETTDEVEESTADEFDATQAKPFDASVLATSASETSKEVM